MKINSQFIGYARFAPIGDGYDIINIYVMPAFRRRGIARAMLENFIKVIKPKSIMLEARKSNTPAINLYTSLGFKAIAERKKYYKNGEDALVMKRHCEAMLRRQGSTTHD